MELSLLLLVLIILAFPIYVLVRLARLGREVEDLKHRLEHLKHRLEQRLTQPAPTPAPERAPAVSPPPPVVPPPTPVIPPQPPERPQQVQPEAVPRPAPPPPPAPPPRPALAARKWDLETLLGANWMAKLGVAAIVLAVGFFLQYAFKSGLIGPRERVIGGLVVALAMLGGGQYLLPKRPYRGYAQVLASGGIAVFFLSIYAAYGLYQLVGFGLAFGALAVGALAASVLTVVNNTPGVAALCVLGAFAAPVLIRETTGVPDPSGLLRLYAYLAILNLWVAGMIRVRSWYSLAMVAFLATWLLFFAAGPLQNAGWITEGFALLFLLGSCYLGAQALYTRAKVPTDMIIGTEKVGIGLILGGCLAFVVASMLILASTGVLGLPGATLAGMLVALLLAGLAVALPPLAHQDREVRLLFGNASAAALALVTTAVLLPAQATPPSQVPGAFAFALFHYLLFLAVALFMHSRAGSAGPAAVLVAANALVHVVMAFHVLGTSHIAGVPAAPLWLPLAGWLALAGAWRAVRQQREAVNLPIALLVTALALPFIGLVVTLPQGGDWPALGALFFFGEFLLVSTTTIALRRALSHLPLRTDLLAALGNSAIFFALIARATGLEAFQGLVLLAGAALAMAAYHAWIGGRVLRRSDDDALRRLTYLGLGLTFGTIAIPLQLRASYITLAWAVEAAVLIWTGITVGERRVRWYGTILLAVAAGKALVLDLLMTPEPFRLLLNTRMLAGAAVIAAAYVAAWLLWRRRVVLAPEERLIPAALTVVANVFTQLFVSLDLWQYLGQIWPRAGRGSAQQLGLSLFWTVYALAAVSVGIWQRTRLVRLFAVGLLYLSIVKVFVFDLSGLEQPYRIVSFFALGVTLLLVSLLYTRFEGRLSEQPAAPTRSPPPTLLLAIALAALSAQAQEDWRTVRPIALPELAAPQLVYLPLDEPALAGVVTLAEYRIIQQDGSVVPYRVMVERGQTESYVLDTRVVSQSPPGSNPVEITLDLGARPASPLNLFLDLEGSNFESRVQIDGSHDQRQWQPIGEGGRVFRQVDGAPQTEIVLPEQDYQFLQVRLFPLQGSLPTVRRVLVSIKLTIPRHLLPVTATLEQREATVETVLELDPGQRVRDLVEARFEIAEPAFDRPVSVEALWDDEGTFLGTHRLRRLAPGGEISLPLEVSQARRVRFTIRNGDDPPLAILGVTLWRVRRGLVFSAAPGQQYQLWYGRPDAPAPEYELERLPLTTPPAALPLAALGPEQALPPPPAPPPPAPSWSEQYPVLFWGVLLGVLGLLMLLIVRSMRRVPSGPPHPPGRS